MLCVIAGLKDYCLTEGFQATCEANEVLVILSAQYGRMATGRCVTRDYGYIGCRCVLRSTNELMKETTSE